MDYKEKIIALLNSQELSKEEKEKIRRHFTELKESEDERIRKELTEFLKGASGGFLDTTIQCKTFGKWLDWLEKQDDSAIAIPQVYETKNGEVITYSETDGYKVVERNNSTP